MRRVVITGLGVIAPNGNNTKDFWQNIIAGKSGAKKVHSFDTSNFYCQVAAEILDFDPSKYLTPKKIKRMDRFVQFAVVSAFMALEDSGFKITPENAERVGVLVGSGIGGLSIIEQQHAEYMRKGPGGVSPFLIPMLIVNMAPGMISIETGAKGPNSCVATACATSTHAVGEAFRLIQLGDADAMFAGGTESCITPLGFGGFDSMKALTRRSVNSPEEASCPFDKRRDGFVMAEGCGILFLEEYECAKKRNAPIYAEIVGYGMSGDAYHMTAPSPDGEGAARCMRNTLKSAQMSIDQVDYINAHGTSTPMNDKFETLAIKNVFGEYAKKIPVSSTKSMTGHSLGAAGGIEAAICALTIRDGIIPPTINYQEPDPECDLDYVPNEARTQKVKSALSNSLGFGGHNSSILMRQV